MLQLLWVRGVRTRAWTIEFGKKITGAAEQGLGKALAPIISTSTPNLKARALGSRMGGG